MSQPPIPTTYYYSPGRQSGQPRITPPKRQNRHSRRLLFISITLLLSLAGWFIMQNKSDSNDASAANGAQKAAAEAQPKEPEVPKTTLTEMETAINGVITKATDVDISAAIIDINSGTLYHYGLPNTVVFTGASVGKLITATAYLHGVEEGTYSMDRVVNGQSASANLQKMIVNSDNDAWHALNNVITYKGLETYAASAMSITDFDSSDNTFSPDDIARLEQLLYQHKLLNNDNTALLLSYMSQANRTDFIKPAVPTLITFYHKAGWLVQHNHDAAIIDDGKNPYVLVIFTKAHTTGTANTHSTEMQAITKATIAHFISSELIAEPTTAASQQATTSN